MKKRGLISDEAPVIENKPDRRFDAPHERPESRLLIVSADSKPALAERIEDIKLFVAQKNEKLSDMAYTLIHGRRLFSHCAVMIRTCVPDRDTGGDKGWRIFQNERPLTSPSIVFVFPGQGAQFVEMGRDLYEFHAVFRDFVDQCDLLLKPLLDRSIKDFICPGDSEDRSELTHQLYQTSIAQPLLFVIESGLAHLLIHYGIRPDILMGHSIGEFTAAYIAGIFELESALKIVASRGRLMQSMPPGSMLAVKAEPSTLSEYCKNGVSLAANNAPGLCVLSGTSDQIERLVEEFESKNIDTRYIKTSHGFHSEMMEPVLDEFYVEVEKSLRSSPNIPIISTMSGLYLTHEIAQSAEYWTQQLRNPVLFAKAAELACDDSERVFVELGPGSTLTTFLARVAAENIKPRKLIYSLGHPQSEVSAIDGFLACLGQLWLHGADPDFNRIFPHGESKLVRMPTYPYQRKRYVVEPPKKGTAMRLTIDTDDYPEGFPEKTSDANLPTFKKVIKLLSDRLGREVIDEDYDFSFIELGFDSLALSQLSSKIHQGFSMKLPIKRLFEDINTPRLLAEHISINFQGDFQRPENVAKEAGSQSPGLPVESHKNIEVRLESIERQLKLLCDSHELGYRKESNSLTQLTGQQQEIWTAVVAGGEQANLAYNECRSFSFNGSLNKRALVDSLNQLYERHDGLRLLFPEDGRQCEIQNVAPVKLLEHDLISLTDDQKLQRISELTSEAVTTPFDLVQGPLFYGFLLYISDQETQLILVAHHIVVDGSSWEILIRELADFYNARCEQKDAEIQEAISISEYRKIRKNYTESIDALEDIQFWREHLEGQTEDLSLPTDGARSPQRTFSAARFDQLLSADTSAQIRKAAAEAGCTAQSFLLAAFQRLIHSLTRQTDFILGIPTSGQAAEGLETFVGHCVHVLPFRSQYDPDMCVGDYLKSLHLNLMAALEHQRTSFSEIVRIVKRKRDMSRPTLVQVSFGMGRSLRRPEFSGVKTEVEVPSRISEAYELYVYITNVDGEVLEVSWSYNTDLFSEETIKAWQRCYEKTIMSILSSAPDQLLSNIDVVSDPDYRQLIELAQGPQVDYSAHIPVHSRIAQNAELLPNKISIRDQSGYYNYKQIEESTNQFARYLLSQDKVSSKLVAVCLDRSFDLVTTLLGIWRAGLGYIPLDPAYPDNRIQMILEDSSEPPVITSQKYKERFPTNCNVICIEEIKDTIAEFKTSAPSVDYSPLDIAYVIFTSGSTGRPKGVQIPQGAVENFICSMASAPGFSENDSLLAITTISFDISVLELFLPLTVGGEVIIASSDQAREPKMLQKLMTEFGITVMQATPATYQMLFDGGWKGHKNLKVLCGGEGFPKHLADRLLANCGEVWNVYGPTETTVWSSVKKIENSDCLTIGRPIDNTTMYVLDKSLRLAPPGAHGDLWIGGHGVADGYIGRDELTKECFRKSPFDDTDRIYRTGDLARIRPDGDFECLGRIDFQIKIRGFRIELGEIETILISHDQVSVGVVVARDDDRGQKYLAAYLVTEGGQDIDTESLRRYLSEKLPAYMVPNHFMVLPSLPMTPNNKVDRKALPPVELLPKAVKSESSYSDSVDRLEEKVLNIFRSYLNYPELTPHDNFFSVGGDSLLAIQIIQKLDNEFDQSLSVNAFLSKPTVKDFTELLRSDANADYKFDLKSIPRDPKIHRQHHGLFPIKEGDTTKPALFLIHGDEANILLPPELPSSLEIWGYHHQGSDGERICYETVEAIAQNCHEEWIEQHGDRECILAGHSFGALVAFHLGVLRQKKQLNTSSMVLLDARNPCYLSGRIFPKNIKQLYRWLRAQYRLRRAKRWVSTARAYLDRGERVPEAMRTDYILGTYLVAANRYCPPTFSGQLTVIRSTQLANKTPNDGWRFAVTGEIQTAIIPGTHLDMVRSKEGVIKIAEHLMNLGITH